MKRLVTLLSVLVLLGSCTVQKSPLKNQLARLESLRGYQEYLNQIIDLQNRHPEKNKTKVTIPVRFYVVRPLENTPLVEESFKETLRYMNHHFKSVAIEFAQVGGAEYLFSSSPVDVFYYNQMLEKEFTKNNYDPNSLNIYIVEASDQLVGFTHYPIEASQRLFIYREKLNDPSLIHELGHYFGLLHTFEEDLSAAERALSCEKTGDKICDTPTDVPGGASFVERDCTLFGDYFDENGEHYKPDLSNYMSYYGNCRSSFSPQQIERMYFIAKNIKIPQLRSNS